MIRWKRQRMPCRFPTTIFIACHTATVLPSTLLRRLRTTFGTEIPRYYGRFQPHYRSITAITAAFARSQTPLPCSFLSPSPLSLPRYGQILDGIVVDGAHIVYCGCCCRYCCYFARGIRRRSIVMTVSVCVSVCLCVLVGKTRARARSLYRCHDSQLRCIVRRSRRHCDRQVARRNFVA